MKSARWSMLLACVWICASPLSAHAQQNAPAEAPEGPAEAPEGPAEAPREPVDTPDSEAAAPPADERDVPSATEDAETTTQQETSPAAAEAPSEAAEAAPSGASQAPPTPERQKAGETQPSAETFDTKRLPVGKQADDRGAARRTERRRFSVAPSRPDFARSAPADPPPAPRFGLGLSLDALWNTHASYDAFSDDDARQRFGVWARYDPLRLKDMLILGVEVGWGAASEETSLLQGDVGTQLDTHALHAAVLLQYAALRWLQPHVRLAGGATRIDATFETDGARFEDGTWAAFGSLGGGFHLQTPPGALAPPTGLLRALTFGVAIEAGYVLAQDVAFDLQPEASEDDIPIRGVPLGELKRSGPYLRFSVYTRF